MTTASATDLVAFGEQSIAKGSKSFGMAAKLFRPEIRADVVMLYAWCRHADDLIDGQEFGFGQQADHRAGLPGFPTVEEQAPLRTPAPAGEYDREGDRE